MCRYYRTLLLLLQQVNHIEITPDRRGIAVAGFGKVRMFDTGSNNPNAVGTW